MGNILPTITIVLAELTAVLLVALAVVLYFNMRKGRGARAEFETLLDPHPENAAASAAVTDAAAHAPATEGVAGSASGETGTPDAPSSQHAPTVTAIDPEFAARIEHDIAELRRQQDSANHRLGQLHHDNTLVSKELERMMENERSDVVHVQKDLVQLRKRVEELESNVETLNAQFADASKTLRGVRMEVDTLSNEYAAAYSNTMQVAEKRGKEPSTPPDAQNVPDAPAAGTGAPEETTPTPDPLPGVDMGMDDDEFALPDEALEAFNDTVAEVGAAPTDEPPERDSDGDAAATAGPSTSPEAPEPAPAPEGDDARPVSSAQTGTGDAAPQNDANVEPQESADGGADAAATDDASTLERLFGGAPATFEAGESREGINVQEISLDELNIDDPHGLTTADPDQPARFEVERLFYQASTEGPGAGQGWYFSVRGGQVHGPFKDKESAERVLNEMIRQYRESGDSGGR